VAAAARLAWILPPPFADICRGWIRRTSSNERADPGSQVTVESAQASSQKALFGTGMSQARHIRPVSPEGEPARAAPQPWRGFIISGSVCWWRACSARVDCLLLRLLSLSRPGVITSRVSRYSGSNRHFSTTDSRVPRPGCCGKKMLGLIGVIVQLSIHHQHGACLLRSAPLRWSCCGGPLAGSGQVLNPDLPDSIQRALPRRAPFVQNVKCCQMRARLDGLESGA